MNIDKKILIQRYDVGYVVTDYTSNRKYAKETAEGVIDVLREALGLGLGLPANLFMKKVDQKNENELLFPSPEPAITISAPALKIEEQFLVQPIAEADKPTVRQKIKEFAQMKDPDGLLIPKFEYDPAQVQKKEIEGCSNISFVELPDGRAMIQYKGTHYYTTKEKVMQKIPYPTPYGHFKRLGVSSTAQTCLRAYRQHLHLKEPAQKKDSEPKTTGSEDGTCDDITFESCANNSPEKCKFCVNESRFEDKNKLAAQKPAPPLMRASVPP